MSKLTYVDGKKFIEWIRAICTNDINFELVLNTIVKQLYDRCNDAIKEDTKSISSATGEAVSWILTEQKEVLNGILEVYPKFYYSSLKSLAISGGGNLPLMQMFYVLENLPIPERMRNLIVNAIWRKRVGSYNSSLLVCADKFSLIYARIAYCKTKGEIISTIKGLPRAITVHHEVMSELLYDTTDPEMEAKAFLEKLKKKYGCDSIPIYHVMSDDEAIDKANEFEGFGKFLFAIRDKDESKYGEFGFLSPVALGHPDEFKMNYYVDLAKYCLKKNKNDSICDLTYLSIADEETYGYLLEIEDKRGYDWPLDDMVEIILKIFTSEDAGDDAKYFSCNDEFFRKIVTEKLISLVSSYLY